MSDIRTKLLGLAAIATAFAGLSYGQVISCTSNPTTDQTLRAEGETELVNDLTASCTNSLATTGSVYAALSLPITSRAESTSSTFAGNSDAVLIVTGTGTPTVYPGTVTGSQVSFANVSYPTGSFTLAVTNIRVNASTGGNPQVTETLLAQYAGAGAVSANATTVAQNVGYILQSLNVSLLQNSSSQNLFLTPTGTTSNFGTCTGNSLSNSTAPNPAFTVLIKEIFAGAFRTQAGEQGSFPSAYTGASADTGYGALATTTGQATQATQLQVAFTNIPSAATIYLPVSITSNGTTLQLQGSLSPLTSPASLVGLPFTGPNAPFTTSPDINGGPGVYGFTPTSGNITAVYTTTATSAISGTTFQLPVYLAVGGGAAPVQTTAMTVGVTYSPTAALTGPASLVPTFAASTVTPINTLTVTPCTTSLLFPFVTNVAGFETGFAIANTTTDNLKNGGTSSQASPASGTCTLYFYGASATNPPAFTTPTPVGVYNATSSTSPVYANTLTAMAGPGFQGYAIATCNFLDAHAFAYIVDNFGTSSGTAEGYLALDLPSNRTDATATGLGH